MFRQRAQLLLDYVSPNKTTDCCGIVDVIGNTEDHPDARGFLLDGSSNKGTSSYSFNNNNSNEKDSDNGDVENVRHCNNNNGGGGGGPSCVSGDRGGQSRDGNRQGGPSNPFGNASTTTATTTLGIDNDNNVKENDKYKTSSTLPSGNNGMSSLSSKTSLHPHPHQPYQPHSSSSSSVEDVNLKVIPDQIFSSTSEAMWTLSPPSSSVLEEEFAIANTIEELGLGDHDGDDRLPYQFSFDTQQDIIPDSNISNSTLNVPTTTSQKRKITSYDFTGVEYVEPSDDCQNYSKSHGLVYEKGPPAKRLKSDGEAMDIEKFKEGGGFLHATSAANLRNGPFANLAPHNFGRLDGGIFANGLKPMVQADKKSKKPMEAVWVMPYGRATSSIAHNLDTHGPALMASGGWVALIMIPADDDRMKNFLPLRTGSNFCKTCHPAYSYGEIPVSPKDVLIVNINNLPVFLKETKVRTDLIPLKTDEEKKATYDLWYHHKGGKEKQAKRSAERYHQEGGKEKQHEQYHERGGKEKQVEQYHEQGGKEISAARYAAKLNRPVRRQGVPCTDATLGPNGVLKCRFDTTLSHSRSKKKTSRPRCALHNWAGIRKQIRETKYCEGCNVHLCIDCFTTFHTKFDLVTVKNQLRNNNA